MDGLPLLDGLRCVFFCLGQGCVAQWTDLTHKS